MNDETGLPDVRSLEAEGKRRAAEARLRALHERWPTSQIYEPHAPVPSAPARKCGGDGCPGCVACTSGSTEPTEE